MENWKAKMMLMRKTSNWSDLQKRSAKNYQILLPGCQMKPWRSHYFTVDCSAVRLNYLESGRTPKDPKMRNSSWLLLGRRENWETAVREKRKAMPYSKQSMMADLQLGMWGIVRLVEDGQVIDLMAVDNSLVCSKQWLQVDEQEMVAKAWLETKVR